MTFRLHSLKPACFTNHPYVTFTSCSSLSIIKHVPLEWTNFCFVSLIHWTRDDMEMQRRSTIYSRTCQTHMHLTCNRHQDVNSGGARLLLDSYVQMLNLQFWKLYISIQSINDCICCGIFDLIWAWLLLWRCVSIVLYWNYVTRGHPWLVIWRFPL